MSIDTAIINYPQSLKSAVYGLFEMFTMANQVAVEQQLNYHFNPRIVDIATEDFSVSDGFDLLLLPPSNDSSPLHSCWIGYVSIKLKVRYWQLLVQAHLY
ncbi:MAG: hypothetical protein MJK10_17825 [Pseudomonadales bacterium]|nr:hypothetical protein [Pseudomonadales bacterium]